MIAFRALAEADLPQVQVWLERGHVALWWREPIQEAMAKRLRRGTTHEYVIVVDGRDAGMIQTYLVEDHPEWKAVVGDEPDLAGVDLLIGEEDLVGRGLGPQALEQFVHDVVFASAPTVAAVATVEEGNRRSWRAFEKAGFRHVRDVVEDGLPHRLMRLERG